VDSDGNGEGPDNRIRFQEIPNTRPKRQHTPSMLHVRCTGNRLFQTDSSQSNLSRDIHCFIFWT
jgi:hypothetical protein